MAQWRWAGSKRTDMGLLLKDARCSLGGNSEGRALHQGRGTCKAQRSGIAKTAGNGPLRLNCNSYKTEVGTRGLSLGRFMVVGSLPWHPPPGSAVSKVPREWLHLCRHPPSAGHSGGSTWGARPVWDVARVLQTLLIHGVLTWSRAGCSTPCCFLPGLAAVLQPSVLPSVLAKHGSWAGPLPGV